MGSPIGLPNLGELDMACSKRRLPWSCNLFRLALVVILLVPGARQGASAAGSQGQLVLGGGLGGGGTGGGFGLVPGSTSLLRYE